MKRAKRRSAQVPGQFLGYSLQTTRATMRLLQAPPGSVVSVEVLDDVAETRVGKHATVEQSKSTAGGNPISDKSVELWKTVANWIRAAQKKTLDPDCTAFELFVSKRRNGKIAQSFNDANSPLLATAAITAARRALWGESPRFAKRPRVAQVLAPHLDCVFDAPLSLAAKVVERLTLSFGSGSSISDLIQLLRAKIISDDMLERVAYQMLGWVKAQIDTLIEEGRPAAVSTDAFNAELTSFVRKYDRFAILNSFAPPPIQAALDLELQNRTYVRQLDLIGADYESKLKAANDRLRASIDRSVWATKGLVHRSSFDDFEDVLTRTWSAKKNIASLQAKGRPPEECGKLLFSECSLVQAQLDGRPVPPHFTPGCYHALADELAVGWHPDFKAVLGVSAARTKGPVS